VMVSHDIREVVTMCDRIVVLDRNPGHVRGVLPNPLPRPRDDRSPAFLALVDRVHDFLTQTVLPDVPAAPAAAGLEPLPEVSPPEVLGLVETLVGQGGQMDLFALAGRARRDFGHGPQVGAPAGRP